MRTCSYCGTENPDQSVRCGSCLTAFSTDPQMQSQAPPKIAEVQERDAGKRQRANGAALLFVGVAFSLWSYLQAVRTPWGGHYFIAIGAICYGAMHFFQGHALATGKIDANDRGQDLLNQAARLEDTDPSKALVVYEQIIAKYPNTRARKEAERNRAVLTSHRSSPSQHTAGSSRS